MQSPVVTDMIPLSNALFVIVYVKAESVYVTQLKYCSTKVIISFLSGKYGIRQQWWFCCSKKQHMCFRKVSKERRLFVGYLIGYLGFSNVYTDAMPGMRCTFFSNRGIVFAVFRFF